MQKIFAFILFLDCLLITFCSQDGFYSLTPVLKQQLSQAKSSSYCLQVGGSWHAMKNTKMCFQSEMSKTRCRQMSTQILSEINWLKAEFWLKPLIRGLNLLTSVSFRIQQSFVNILSLIQILMQITICEHFNEYTYMIIYNIIKNQYL